MPKLGGSDWLIKLRSMSDLMEGVNDDARSYIPRVLLISCLDAMCGFKEGRLVRGFDCHFNMELNLQLHFTFNCE